MYDCRLTLSGVLPAEMRVEHDGVSQFEPKCLQTANVSYNDGCGWSHGTALDVS